MKFNIAAMLVLGPLAGINYGILMFGEPQYPWLSWSAAIMCTLSALLNAFLLYQRVTER